MIDWLRKLFAPAPPWTCPGCGHAKDEWQEDVIRGGYVETRLWRGCPMYRIAAGLHDFEEMNRHWAKWTLVSGRPLHG